MELTVRYPGLGARGIGGVDLPIQVTLDPRPLRQSSGHDTLVVSAAATRGLDHGRQGEIYSENSYGERTFRI